MRRLTKIAAASAVLALALAGCGGNNTDEETNTGASEDVCTDASGDGPKIGLAYDVGGRGDQSFNDSAYVGMAKAVEDLDATCREVEAGTGENDADREERLRLLADAGFNPVIAVGFVYSPAVATVAAEYPDVNFAVVDGYATSIQEQANVADLTFAEHEGSFLVGVAAALTTEKKNVGFVGGVNGPLIQKFEAGFKAGVEAVDPSIEIQTQYLSQDDPQQGFENPAGGETAATGMYDNGADVVYHAAGKSGLGVFDAVEVAGEGNWAIGVDSDQWLTVDKAQQPFILTSMLKRIDTAVFEYTEAFGGGEAPSGFVTYDVASGGIDYATSGDHLPEDVISEIESYKEQIVNGDVTVPSTVGGAS